MKKIFLFLCLLFFSFGGFAMADVKNDNTVHIFTSPTCPHCSSAKDFLKKFQKESGLEFSIKEYDISKNLDQAKVFYENYSVPKKEQGFVPAIFFGEKYFVGFNKQAEEELVSLINSFEEKVENSVEDEIISDNEKKEKIITVPFLGQINMMDFSLPILAIVLGVVDGFNVCSLGALVIILGLVMVLGSRGKIFLVGGAFLLTTGIVYGVLIFLWHQFFSFIAPHIRSMEILIGILALGGGAYLLKEFYQACKTGPVCSSNNLMSRLTPKIKKIFKTKTNWWVLIGAVALFAVIVTIVEFPCSAFLPVLFTGILVESGTSLGMSLFYVGLYMIFYLLDEAIIFAIAVWTLRIKIVSPKFIIFFNLLAALIFIFLGTSYLWRAIGV